MNLECPELRSFRKDLEEIVDIAFTTGGKCLNKKGVSGREQFSKRPDIYREFVSRCHSGYNVAQQLIAQQILELWETKEKAKAKLLQARAEKDEERVGQLKNIVDVVDNRILVLRRVVDSIAFTLFRGEVWVTRRFVLHAGVRQINIDAIKANYKSVFQKNNSNRLAFSVITDLTTFVHVGDLLEIDFSSGGPVWRVVELKTGAINEKLQKISESKKEYFSDSSQRLTKKEQDQLNRILKQKERENKVSVLRGNPSKVSDISLNMDVALGEEVISYEGYGLMLRDIMKEADKKGAAIAVIDECLFVSCVAGEYGKAVHGMCHLISDTIECAFLGKNQDAMDKERIAIDSLSKSHYLVDLCTANMYAQSSNPFFLYPIRKRHMFKLLFGEMHLLVYFDMDRFLSLCKKSGVLVKPCGGKETDSIQQEFGRDLVPLHNKRAINVDLGDGFAFVLFGGSLHKIWFEFMSPSQLIAIWQHKKEVFLKDKGGI